jgi:hypothetical protein
VVADSDRVVVGRLTKVTTVSGDNKKSFEVATVKVSQTLKGPRRGRGTFLIRNYDGAVAKKWGKLGVPILFCLVSAKHARREGAPLEKVAWVLRDNGNEHCAVLLGNVRRDRTFTIEVFTKDFEVLTDPRSIIKTVTGFLRSHPKIWKKRSHTLDVPFGTPVHKKLYDDSTVELTVPLDTSLEKLGRRWCRSESYWRRIEGVKILAYFKNGTNISILRNLLKDSSSSVETRHVIPLGKAEAVLVYRKRIWQVRKLAYEALRGFEIKVPKPVIEKTLNIAR